MSKGRMDSARGMLSDWGRISEMHQWRELGFSKEREGESQTELWPQTETDEYWEVRNSRSHILTENPDKFFHQCIKETLHADTWSSGNRYFVQHSSFSNRVSLKLTPDNGHTSSSHYPSSAHKLHVHVWLCFNCKDGLHDAPGGMGEWKCGELLGSSQERITHQTIYREKKKGYTN